MNNRLESLDIFRGMTVAGMIIVNNPGSWSIMYPIVRHAKWDGCTFADLIFPFFLYIVGVSIYLAITKYQLSLTTIQIYKKILFRTIILFLLGIILNGFPDYNFSEIRIPGVLQRIAVVYFFSSILFLNFSKNWLGILFFGILVFYTFLFLCIPPPGESLPTMDTEKNIAAYIDRLFLKGHVWKYTKTWDPEGILSTLPSIATSISGILTGYILFENNRSEKSLKKIYTLFAIGIVCIILGLLLNFIFPINKNLWTSSYTLFTSGIACIYLMTFIYFFDIKKIQSISFIKSFFSIFSLNALFLYFISGIFARILNLISIQLDKKEISLKLFLYKKIFGEIPTPLNSLLYSVLFLIVVFIVGLILKKRNIRISP
ncbi:MAG: DUF5009 domain-containing protein [Leptospiraceae bacterium]|nr:DUF5009 domain-containing protein [Leptospiraceae bacterium]MCK6381285.1 DUF5009 domain-containing protein [Leptospiraceae bacterium]NUM40402.1 DUF5009 domain-containing protein [Leptospiraceae bacterium]